MKQALIILSVIAVILGLISFFVVFYSGGNYVVSSPLPSGAAYSSSTIANTSSTASSTLSDASSTPGGALTDGSSTLAEYASDYNPSPMAWNEGLERLSITGATLSGSQLILKVSVQMGNLAQCVPMNIRLVANEKGDLTLPLTTQFALPENGTCEGAPGALYNDQEVIFTVDPTTLPLVFTTGGTSNEFFELSTDAHGGITIAPPPTSG